MDSYQSSGSGMPEDPALSAKLEMIAAVTPMTQAAGEIRRQLIEVGFEERTADTLGAEFFRALLASGMNQ